MVKTWEHALAHPEVKSGNIAKRPCEIIENTPLKKSKLFTKDNKTSELIHGLVLYFPSKSDNTELNHICVLNESVQKSKKVVQYIESDAKISSKNLVEYTTDVIIEGKCIASGTGTTKKEAKHCCAESAIVKLKERQRIVYKAEVNHDHVETVEKGQLVRAAYMNADKLDDNNVGNKLLRKMGWSGSGGIGKYKHGISDPVFVDSNERREGVGHQFLNRCIRKSTVEETLLSFLHDRERLEMKFASELSREDRALVHRLCQRYHLKHKSFGKDKNRYLVVSKSC